MRPEMFSSTIWMLYLQPTEAGSIPSWPRKQVGIETQHIRTDRHELTNNLQARLVVAWYLKAAGWIWSFGVNTWSVHNFFWAQFYNPNLPSSKTCHHPVTHRVGWGLMETSRWRIIQPGRMKGQRLQRDFDVLMLWKWEEKMRNMCFCWHFEYI